jgi:acyl-CoA synthetase (AMP-forming)/AMP-acid ligase II
MTEHATQPPEPRFLDDRPAYWAEATPEAEAFNYLDRTWTWAEWNDRVRRLAGALSGFGVGRIDEDGFIYIEDRLKDMIISAGENIYSIEVERALAEHPAVAEVAVIGVPDQKWGESVKAVVALDPDAGAGEDELIAWSRERLAGYKCPKTVNITDALPRNPTGKILKKDLRKPFWEGRDRSTV